MWRGDRGPPERRVTRSAAARPPVRATAGTTSTGAIARPASGICVADGEVRAPAMGTPRPRSRLRSCRAPGLDERGQLPQGLSTARLIVLRPNTRRNILAQDGNSGSLVGIGETRGDFHVAGEARILRFEHDHFDDLLVGHQFDESALESIRVTGSLAAGRMRRVLV